MHETKSGRKMVLGQVASLGARVDEDLNMEPKEAQWMAVSIPRAEV